MRFVVSIYVRENCIVSFVYAQGDGELFTPPRERRSNTATAKRSREATPPLTYSSDASTNETRAITSTPIRCAQPIQFSIGDATLGDEDASALEGSGTAGGTGTAAGVEQREAAALAGSGAAGGTGTAAGAEPREDAAAVAADATPTYKTWTKFPLEADLRMVAEATRFLLDFEGEPKDLCFESNARWAELKTFLNDVPCLAKSTSLALRTHFTKLTYDAGISESKTDLHEAMRAMLGVYREKYGVEEPQQGWMRKAFVFLAKVDAAKARAATPAKLAAKKKLLRDTRHLIRAQSALVAESGRAAAAESVAKSKGDSTAHATSLENGDFDDELSDVAGVAVFAKRFPFYERLPSSSHRDMLASATDVEEARDALIAGYRASAIAAMKAKEEPRAEEYAALAARVLLVDSRGGETA